MTLRCRGTRACRVAVRLTLLTDLSSPDDNANTATCVANLLLRFRDTTKCTRSRLLLRDALVTLDGKCLGMSYREVAAVIYGAERVRTSWSSESRWMKDHIRRAYAKGKELRDGGFRDLLHLGCRFS